ncbi:MAG: hypothetical protein K6B68_06895 [Eubacterium sp.]|nr:hypothetical protein [Eubacterium sp.]
MLKAKKFIAISLSSIMMAGLVTGGIPAGTGSVLGNDISYVYADEPGAPPDGNSPDGGMPGGSSSSNVSWTGATEITSSTKASSPKYSSTTADQNSVLINTSSSVKITNPTVTKSGNSSGGDSCNFYGINSAIMAKGGGVTEITGGTVKATARGANGVFSYGGNGGQNGAAGDGTTVKITNTKITTTGDNAGGIMTTGGGKTIATNLTINTSGQSSAPIRTDRGGGTVTVTNGTYTSTGQGSPAIYSTADITVSDATLVSKKSEGVVIEGKNSVTLNNCKLTATNNALNGNATFYDTIMIYQSQSGDAATGTSSFKMTNGSIISNKGAVFHVTNTNAKIALNNVNIKNTDSKNVLISVCSDGWSGASNIATLTAKNQTLNGNILVGSDSQLTLKLAGATTFTGKTSGSITNDKGSTVSSSLGNVKVVMSGGKAVWKLTGNCKVTSISGSGMIDYNGYTLTVGNKKYKKGNIGTIKEATYDVVFQKTDKTLPYAKLKTQNLTYSVIKKSNGGKVTYKVLSGKSAYVKVSTKGTVTVKKGAPKGVYKVQVTVAAKGKYKKTTKTIKITVK